MTLRWFTLAGPLLVASALSACGSMATASDAPGLAGTSWVLAGLPGRTLRAGPPATLQFGASDLGGSDGCNRYSGPYAAAGGHLEVSSQLAATEMACAPDVMAQAQAFVAALTGARGYRLADGRLELLGGDGTVLATLAAQSQALAGTTWRATGINNGRGGVVSALQQPTVTLAFAADGRVSGSAGCNRYTATYRSDGPALAFSQPAVTRRLCAQPAGVMQQEQQFLAALATVSTARIEGDRLELRTAAGALAVGLTRGD